MLMRMQNRLNKREVWTVPAILGVLTCTGLVAALISDGPGDVISWLTLAVPVFIVGYCLLPDKRH